MKTPYTAWRTEAATPASARLVITHHGSDVHAALIFAHLAAATYLTLAPRGGGCAPYVETGKTDQQTSVTVEVGTDRDTPEKIEHERRTAEDLLGRAARQTQQQIEK